MLVGVASDPIVAQEQPSGSAIYSRVIAAMRAVAMPRYVVSRVTSVHNGMSLTLHIQPKTHAFMYAFPSFDGSTLTNTATVRYDTSSEAGALMKDGKDVLALAPFPIAPEVSALVRTGIDTETTPVPAPTPTAGNQGIAMVASVRAFYSAHYQIDNVGTEQLDGAPAYHLRLTAKDGDTSTYPLTDMYVDPTTYLVRRVVLGGGQRGFFQGGGGFGQFDFSKVGD